MRRLIRLLAVLAILAIVVAVVWRLYGDQIHTRYVLFRCDRVWRNVKDFQTHVQAQVNQGSLSLTVSGEARFKVPDAFRLELDQIVRTEIIARADKVWVTMPTLKAAVEVVFEKGSPVANALRSRRAGRWLNDAVRNPGTRVVGKATVTGHRCYAIRVPAAQEPAPAGTPAGPAGHTMLYVDTRTLLPVQAVAVGANLAPLATLTLKDTRINQGFPESDFDVKPSADWLVVRRVFDPEHPESLILPPVQDERGRGPRAGTWDDFLHKMDGMWNPQGVGAGSQSP